MYIILNLDKNCDFFSEYPMVQFKNSTVLYIYMIYMQPSPGVSIDVVDNGQMEADCNV